MHVTSEPAILYFGTPVVIISTVNEDGTYNLAPMSSVFWIGWRCMLGLGARSKTPQNMLRTRECVLNLPSVDQVTGVVEIRLAPCSEVAPCEVFGDLVAWVRVLDAHDGVQRWRGVGKAEWQLDLPDANAAVSAMLLEHADG